MTPNRWLVFSVAAVGVLMATLDASIVNITLPAMAAGFGVALGGSIEWVIIAYLLVIASTLLTFGRIADLVGHKRLWLLGLSVFIIGSTLCGASRSLNELVVFRVVQGLGGAMLMAISPAMITGAFPASERGRALGLNATVVALGISTGPALGGFITHELGWRWVFYVNPPIGFVGLILAAIVLPSTVSKTRASFDVPGAVFVATGLGALTAVLTFGPKQGFASPSTIGLCALAVAGLVALIWRERRCVAPLIDLALFRSRIFASASASLVICFFGLFAVNVMLPFYFTDLRHFSVEQAGLMLTPLPLCIGLLGPLSGALSDKLGTRGLAATGISIATVGLVMLSRLDASTSVAYIVVSLVVMGCGQALFQSPNNNALMGSAPKSHQGVAAGMLATGRVVGQSLSVAVAGVVFAALGGAQAGFLLAESGKGLTSIDIHSVEQTFVHAFRVTLLMFAGIAAVGVPVSLTRGRSRPPSA